MYYDGLGVKQDYRKALELFQILEGQGYASAQHNLGVMYEKGEGVKQDYEKAAQWYQEAQDRIDQLRNEGKMNR